MPIKPDEHEIVLDALVDRRRGSHVRGSKRKATPSVRSASPASSSLTATICRAPLGRRGPHLLADKLSRAAREQHVGRALREDERAPVALASV